MATLHILVEHRVYEAPVSVSPDEALDILRALEVAGPNDFLMLTRPEDMNVRQLTYRLIRPVNPINLLDPFRVNDRIIAELNSGPKEVLYLWNLCRSGGWTLRAIQLSLKLLKHRGIIVSDGNNYALPEPISAV